VKNSYDASANEVDIIFRNIVDNTGNARIIVRDDGHGMSFEDIKSKWLFIGYSEKKGTEKDLKKFDYRDKIGVRRVFAGAKGIGRFSCDRLGDKLILYSKTLEENIVHKLSIDWNKFEEDAQQEFQSIIVDYEVVTEVDIDGVGFPKNQGVILEIFSTANKINWDQKKLITLKKRLSRLINPSHVTTNLDFSIFIHAKEFQKIDDEEINKIIDKYNKKKKNMLNDDVELTKKEIDEIIEKEIDITKSMLIINGYIDNFIFEQLNIKTTHLSCEIDLEDGSIYTKITDKGDFIYDIKEVNDKYPLLKGIIVDLFYLNPLAKSMFTRLMGLQPVRYGSIFLYKNGFKINPYGNEGDDWLGLELRKGQGYARTLATRELMGRIEVIGYNPNIQEVSSRDGGVIITDEFNQLKIFFKDFPLKRLENYVIEALDWDNPLSKKPKKSDDDIKMDSLKLISSFAGLNELENKEVRFNKELVNIYQSKEVEKTSEIIHSLELFQNEIKDINSSIPINLNVKTIHSAFTTLINQQKQLEKDLKVAEKRALFLEYVSQTDEGEFFGLQHQINLSSENIRGILLSLKKKIEMGVQISILDMHELISFVLIQIDMIQSISLYFTNIKYDLEYKQKLKTLYNLYPIM